jgi:hypothetical protein
LGTKGFGNISGRPCSAFGGSGRSGFGRSGVDFSDFIILGMAGSDGFAEFRECVRTARLAKNRGRKLRAGVARTLGMGGVFEKKTSENAAQNFGSRARGARTLALSGSRTGHFGVRIWRKRWPPKLRSGVFGYGVCGRAYSGRIFLGPDFPGSHQKRATFSKVVRGCRVTTRNANSNLV